MDIEHTSDKERYEMLAEMADMYYNQGHTQSEIAAYFNTNRFRVAKLLQDARNEQIVEIKINYSNERNVIVERQLMETFPLNKAIVVNTQYSPYTQNLMQVGKVGANYLAKLLTPDTSMGVMWGKTIYSVVSQLKPVVNTPISIVQLAGYLRLANPTIDCEELIHQIAMAYSSPYHYLPAPIYVSSTELRSQMLREPMIQATLEQTKHLDIILSGIGGSSSMPLINPAVKPYLTQTDIQATSSCIGSLYGYVLDKEGRIADIDLNQKVISANLSDILTTPHRLVIARGRHKIEVLQKALKNRLFNELVTDMDTATHMLQ